MSKRPLDCVIEDEYRTFRLVLVCLCLIFGTIIMFLAVVFKFDLFVGMALVLAGAILLIVDTFSRP